MENTASKGFLMIYTRTPITDCYSSHLAYSAHLAYSSDGRAFTALNRNYGVFFVTSTIAGNNTINEKGLKKPYIFYTANGDFGIIAIRVNADGSNDEESRGKAVISISKDLVNYTEIGLVDLGTDAYVQEISCEYNSSKNIYEIVWKDDSGNFFRNTLDDINNTAGISPAVPGGVINSSSAGSAPDGAVAGNILEVDIHFADELLLKFSSLVNTDIKVPGSIRVSSIDEINPVTAKAIYSDGSEATKKVQWNTDKIDFTIPGEYEISGTVTQDIYPFPLAIGYADPVIFQWDGKYYFIATNDNTDDIGLFVREADTVAGLFDENVKEHIILDFDESKGFIQTFWAPEFHVIGNELYILFAVSGITWGPQSHIMKLKKGGHITDPGSWENPVRVERMDGSYLTEEGITLDMTYFEASGISYLVWSYRMHTGTSEDTGSMLYIATIDPATPWRLTSEPVQLSRPLYGWENNEHTINNEGPYAIVTDDHVYITYSGGSAGGYTYVLGLLTAKLGNDLLCAGNWEKSNAPVLSYYSVKNEYGPGHNSFFKDEHGNLMIAYHAQETMKRSPRCTAIRRVHFTKSGAPVFDISPDQDMDEGLAHVKTTVIVDK